MNRYPIIAAILYILLCMTGCTKPYVRFIRVVDDPGPPRPMQLGMNVSGQIGPEYFVHILQSANFWDKRVAPQLEDNRLLKELHEGFSVSTLPVSKIGNAYVFDIRVSLKNGNQGSFDLIYSAFSELLLTQQRANREGALESLQKRFEQVEDPEMRQAIQQRIESLLELQPTHIIRVSVVQQ